MTTDHLSGKPGNVREFDNCQGNVRDFTKSQGNVMGKIPTTTTDSNTSTGMI